MHVKGMECIILCVTHVDIGLSSVTNQNHIYLFMTSLFIPYSIFIFNNIDRPYSKLSISVNSLGRRKMEIKMTF